VYSQHGNCHDRDVTALKAKVVSQFDSLSPEAKTIVFEQIVDLLVSEYHYKSSMEMHNLFRSDSICFELGNDVHDLRSQILSRLSYSMGKIDGWKARLSVLAPQKIKDSNDNQEEVSLFCLHVLPEPLRILYNQSYHIGWHDGQAKIHSLLSSAIRSVRKKPGERIIAMNLSDTPEIEALAFLCALLQSFSGKDQYHNVFPEPPFFLKEDPIDP
jgi:hypothetical protein